MVGWEEEFDELQEAWEGQRFEKGSLREANIKDFIAKEKEKSFQEGYRASVSGLKEIFHDWAGKSNYVTGAWSTGEYADRSGEYWDFISKSAWGQFANMLDEKLAGRTIDSLTQEGEANDINVGTIKK